MLDWFKDLSEETQRLAHVTGVAWAVTAICGIILTIFGDSVLVLVAASAGLAAVCCTFILAAKYVEGE